nr:MAG TPA: hypothetical protein [Caudoviricetes sp.]
MIRSTIADIFTREGSIRSICFYTFTRKDFS